MFEDLWARAEPHTLVSRDRCEVLYREALAAPAGDFVEVGVYQGGTALLLASLVRPGYRLYACDTFRGLPAGAISGLDDHVEGEFSSPRRAAERLLRGLPVRLVEGVFPASASGDLTWPPPCGLALAHIDVDLYCSVRACSLALLPLMLPGGVLVFDDYGFPQCRGAKAAVDELFPRAEALSTGQAVVRC